MEPIIVTCCCHNSCRLPYVRSLASSNRSARQCLSTQGMLDDQPPSALDSRFISPDLCRLTTPITIQLTTKSGASVTIDKSA